MKIFGSDAMKIFKKRGLSYRIDGNYTASSERFKWINTKIKIELEPNPNLSSVTLSN